MKKILTAVLFVLLVCAASASLAQKGESKSFQFLACCTEAKTIQWDADNYLEKDQNDHKVYVRHWVSGGSDEYTNLFQARDWYEGRNYGSKWATVGLNVPIQSNSIVLGRYCMAGRGNTNHYNYDGVSSVYLHGNFYADL